MKPETKTPPSLSVALVTGGTRGIGLGIAKRLIQDGFAVMLNGVRPEESVADVLRDLRDGGATVAYCAGDIADAAAREKLIAATRDTFGA